MNYLTYDGDTVTYEKLTYSLGLAEAFLYDAEVKAYEQGHEELSDVFAEARDLIIDMMPVEPPKRGSDANQPGLAGGAV